LAEAGQIRAAVEGVDLVVHAAHGDNARAAAEADRLLAAMGEAHAPNLIALSSIAVYGSASGRVDETTPPRGALGAYAAGKVACERSVRAWASDPAAPGRRALILRPGIVYGTGSRFWIDKLVERIRSGAWADFGPEGEGAAALIHVDDLVGMIVAAARAMMATNRDTSTRCRVLNAVGPETATWNAYFEALARKIGAPLAHWDRREIARRRHIALLAKIAMRLGANSARLRRAALAPTLGEIALFSRRAIYATDAAAREGFRPGVGLTEG
jgi:nucleoside-diphosphate-sugar epimerase